MRRRLVPFLFLVVLALALPGAASAALSPPSAVATVPHGKPLYVDGQDHRVLLDGPWLFRPDPQDAGRAQRFYAQGSIAGWSGTTVPYAWNAGDDSMASFMGSVAWYRKDFRLPNRSAALSWIVRFESANFHATVWLNGRQIGDHVGGYVPFELDLANVARKGVNRLVVRVDNRRPFHDPNGDASDQPQPPGGWWNYGGLLREVYLRRVDRIDLPTVAVAPSLPCPTCSATVTTSAVARNVTSTAQRVHLTARFGRSTLDLGTQTIGARRSATFARSLRVRHPRLWSPAHPTLYAARVAASAGPANGKGKLTPAAGYRLHSGIRSLRVTRAGLLLLNGKPVHVRGVALHEDTLTQGAAVDNATRARIVSLTHDLGATLIRSHYPLHPELQELADRTGLLLWSEVPAMYQLPELDIARSRFRALAFQELQADVLANRNHPSVAIWSVGNEMPAQVGSGQAAYIRDAATLVRTLDPTRPVGVAFAGHPEDACQAGYAPLDVLGMNDYFGWYTGSDGDIADRDLLSSYLDQLRRCYPSKAIVVSEYGAEANRDGPVEEKGTFAFQSDFVQFQASVFNSKSWLAGSVYWALQEFRVRPGWGGGNPWGTPPYHTKGLVRLDWSEKPAYAILRGLYRAVRQFG